MADDRTITIGIDVDSGGAVRGIKRVEGATVDLEQEGGGSGMSFGETMNFALGELAASAAQQLAGQIGALISQGQALLGRASEISETQSKFNTVFGESSSVVQDFIDKQARLMGLTDQQAQALLSSAGAQAQALGFAKEQSAEFSKEIATLAGDLASFNNAEPQQAFEALTSALNGERERLKQFDIAIRENMVQQRALANTSKESAEALTQQEKAAATLELAYDKAGAAVGDLERTSESAANTGRQAGAAWREVRDTFAEQLLPAAADINQELLELAENEEVMQATRDAARELSEQLTAGIKLASDFFELFAENGETLATVVRETFRLVTAVGAYTAAVKTQALLTKGLTAAMAAYRAATSGASLATKGLNAAMRLNPVGAVVSGLTILLPLLYRFQDGISDAAAAVLDFSANAIRGLDSVVQSLESLASSIPDALATGPLGIFKAGVQSLDAAVDASADTMEGWADSLRKVGEETEDLNVEMGENKNQVDFNTEAVEGNTEAVRENAQAREEAANAPPPVPPPEVEEPKNQVIEPDVSFDMESLISDAESAEQALRAGLIQSINEADTAIRELQVAYDSATTKRARQEIQAMIDKLRGHRDEMEAAKKELVDFGPAVEKAAEQALTNFGEGIGEMMAGVSTAADVGKSVLKTLASLAERVGKIAIGAGVAVEGIKRALQSLNPVAAIAAGTALIALAAAVRSRLSSVAEGPGGGSEDERPSRASVPRMRSGGRVEEGRPVLVGDGPGGRITPYSELFVPETSGTIVPRSQMNVTRGAKRQGGQGQLEEKLDEVKAAFQEKQFRLRGRDMVTQQERQQAVYDDAGIK